MLDVASMLGMSNTVMRLIERRSEGVYFFSRFCLQLSSCLFIILFTFQVTSTFFLVGCSLRVWLCTLW